MIIPLLHPVGECTFCHRSLVSKFCNPFVKGIWKCTRAKYLFLLLLLPSLSLPVLCRNLKHNKLGQAWLCRTSLLSCPPHLGLMLTAIPNVLLWLFPTQCHQSFRYLIEYPAPGTSRKSKLNPKELHFCPTPQSEQCPAPGIRLNQADHCFQPCVMS